MFKKIIYYIINTAWKLDKSKGKRTDAESLFYNIRKNQIMGRYNFAKKFVKNKKVLDIACGEGIGSFILASEAKEVLGIDNDKEIIKRNKKNYKRKNLKFKVGNAENLRLVKKLDVIISLETIEHLHKPEKFLYSLYKYLKKDGLLILSTPNKEFIDICFNGKYLDPDHKKEFYLNELKNILHKGRFRNIKVYYYHLSNRRSKWFSFLYYFLKNGFKVVPKQKNMNIMPIMFVLSARK